MGDSGIGALLDRLRSSDAPTAWEEFLCQYSPVLYQTARASTADAERGCGLLSEIFASTCPSTAFGVC
jgi:hypothetical protein